MIININYLERREFRIIRNAGASYEKMSLRAGICLFFVNCRPSRPKRGTKVAWKAA
jgi:hypothetical protein